MGAAYTQKNPFRGNNLARHRSGGNLPPWAKRIRRKTRSEATKPHITVAAATCRHGRSGYAGKPFRGDIIAHHRSDGNLPPWELRIGGKLRFMVRGCVYEMFMAADCRRYDGWNCAFLAGLRCVYALFMAADCRRYGDVGIRYVFRCVGSYTRCPVAAGCRRYGWRYCVFSVLFTTPDPYCPY